MNSLGLRHAGCRYRRSVPMSTKWCRAAQPLGTTRPERMPRPSATESDQPAKNPHARARYRRSVPCETSHTTCASLQPVTRHPPQKEGIAEASRPTATWPEPVRANHARPLHGITEASRAKPVIPHVPAPNQSHGPRYRRNVPKSTSTPEGRCRLSVPTDGPSPNQPA